MTTDRNTGDHPESSDPGASSDDDKLEQLAARFLALWREQVAATADGVDAASAIGRLYASLGADTTRMGEGFEAWGKLIGQMAMGQQAAPQSANPFAAAFSGVTGENNPLMAMMDQMAKAARDLPTAPFPTGMPFPPNMAVMAGMPGMSGMGAAGAKPSSSAPKADQAAHGAEDKATEDKGADGVPDKTTDKTGKKASATSPDAASKKTRAAKNTAKGQGKNDQSTETKAASAKKTKPETGRAAAASDAHGSRDDELAQLTRRIADLSETIAALEAGTEGTGRKPPKRD